MGSLNGIPKTYDEAVRALAAWHATSEDQVLAIYSFPDPFGQVVRLVEVTPVTPPTGTFEPFMLGRRADFPFRSAIAQVTPDEWTLIAEGRISPPPGWSLATSQKVFP